MITLDLPPEAAQALNVRPFGLRHDLCALPMFGVQSLAQLASEWPDLDYFVAEGAATPGTTFYDARAMRLHPREAFGRLGHGSCRILLKRLERRSSAWRDLLQSLYTEVCSFAPWLRDDELLRLESFLFISSAETITPFHFDPEMNFFFQIDGGKTYHLYAPDVLPDEDLEPYYLRGRIDIGQVDFARTAGKPEYRFDLVPGTGMHQPIHAPHWVQTGAGLSVSYSFSVETTRTRALGRTRAFNGLMRRLGSRPTKVGANPAGDHVKAGVMHAVRPLLDSVIAMRRMVA